MGLFERIFLKDVSDFQELTTEQKKQYLTLHYHQHLAIGLASSFLTIIPNTITLVICVVNLIILICIGGVLSHILFYTTMPLAITILGIELRYFRKMENYQEARKYLAEKVQNLWLLNWQVISFKDWKNIKKRCKTLYYGARSEACNHECYTTTYALANTLKNPEIKILWISVQCEEKRYGHAVILKNGKIYDSNLRRTFNYDKYFKAFNVEIFKEYSIAEYLGKDILPYESSLFASKWEEFGEWCKNNNVVRNT